MSPDHMNKPMRLCVACRTSIEKDLLIRVVCTPDGELMTDAYAIKEGRGAYVCKNADCIATAAKRHALERSLRAKNTDTIYEELFHLLDETK